MANFSSAVINILAKDRTKEGVKSAQKGIGGLTKAIKSYGAEMAAAAAAMYGVVKIIKDSLGAYIDYENKVTALKNVLKSTGNQVGITSDAMLDYADKLQEMTTYSNTAVIGAETLMTTFTQIGNKTFPKAIEAAMDMSTTFGQDLQQSVVQLGTALNDPIQGVGRLRRIGVSFTEQQKESIKTFMDQNNIMGAQNVILKELHTEFGNAAKAAGQTFGGQVKALKNHFSDLQKEMGFVMANRMKPMIPLVDNLVKHLTNWLKTQRELKAAYETIKKPMKDATDQMKLENILAREKILSNRILVQQRKIQNNLRTPAVKGMREELMSMVAQQKTLGRLQHTMEGIIQKKKDDIEKTKAQIKANKASKDAVDKVTKSTDAWKNTIVYSGKALDNYEDMQNSVRTAYQDMIPQIQNVAGEVKNNDDAVKNLNNTFGVFNSAAYDMSDGIGAISTSYKDLKDNIKGVKDAYDNLNDTQKMFVDVTTTLATAAGSASDSLRAMAKEGAAMLLKALGKILLTQAALNWFHPLKAAAMAIAGFAAIAGAAAIQRMQQGGVVKAQQGYGGGDTVPAMLEPGEMVIPKEVVRNNQSVLNSMNAGGQTGNVINVYLDGKKLQGIITKWTENGQLRIAPRAVR